MKQLIKKVGVPVGLFVFLILFLLVTSPDHLPLPLLIVPFGIIFYLLFFIFKELGATGGAQRRQRLIRAAVLAAIPVLLLVLQTIHQLTIKDILITIGLVLLATYYVNKADFL